MPSQFFGLNIAYSGLLASNAALNTTANNIANSDTPGYSKQVVKTAASDALRTFTTYGCAGAGVDTLAVERLRNGYYDTRYWNNQANYGEYDVKNEYMGILEDYFADDDYTTGFNTIFNTLFSGLQEIMTHAGDTTYNQAFITKAQSLSEYFNAMYGNLQNVQRDLNAEIKTNVDQINSFADEIASLNQQINVIELSGSAANELRDQRDYLVDQLSKIVDVEITETPVYDANNPDRETGATRCTVQIAGGQTLVDGQIVNKLECIGRSNTEKVNQSDINGLYDIQWSNGNKFDLNNASMGGTLKGLIDMRDGNNNEYFNGTIAGIGALKDVNGVSHQTLTVNVDATYLKDINKSNLSEMGKIQIEGQEVYYDSWTFNYDETTDTYSYVFTLSDSSKNTEAVSNGKIGQDANVGVANSYQGVPYYMEQMNEWLRDFSETFNGILTQPGSIASNGEDAAQNLFMANSNTANVQFDCTGTPDKTGSYSISCSDNSYYKITAGTFAINIAIEKNADLLATHTVASDGEAKYDIIEQLIDMQTNKDVMSFRGCSSSEFLQCILADVSLNKGSAKTFCDKYEDLGNSIDKLRMSVSGVDQDEEGVSLVKYQNAFTLASKMIGCFTEVYDRLILETGV